MLVAALNGRVPILNDSCLGNPGPLPTETVVSPDKGRLGLLLLVCASFGNLERVVRYHGL